MSSSRSSPAPPTRAELRAFLAKRDPAMLHELEEVDRLAEMPRKELNLHLLSRYSFSLDFPDCCLVCRKPSPASTPFLSCAKCQSAIYCSSQCQAQHWPLHKPSCRARTSVFQRGEIAERMKKLTLDDGSDLYLIQAVRIVEVHRDDPEGLYYTCAASDNSEAQVSELNLARVGAWEPKLEDKRLPFTYRRPEVSVM